MKNDQFRADLLAFLRETTRACAIGRTRRHDGRNGGRQLPADLQGAFTAELERIVASAKCRSRFEPLGVTATALTGRAFTEFQRAETLKWGAAVRNSGATSE